MPDNIIPGISGGALSGLEVGAPLGPIGMGAGAVLGGISGLISGQNANKRQADFQKADRGLSPYDPMQMALLEKIRSQRRMFQMGTDPTTAYRNRLAMNTGATTAMNVERAGGPDAINGLLRVQNNTNSAVQSNGAAGANYGQELLGMEGALTNHLADYAQNLQMQRRNEALARSEQARQDINDRFTASLGAIPGIASHYKVNNPDMNVAALQTPTPIAPNPAGYNLPQSPTNTQLY